MQKSHLFSSQRLSNHMQNKKKKKRSLNQIRAEWAAAGCFQTQNPTTSVAQLLHCRNETNQCQSQSALTPDSNGDKRCLFYQPPATSALNQGLFSCPSCLLDLQFIHVLFSLDRFLKHLYSGLL